jgi:hypothetical protein
MFAVIRGGFTGGRSFPGSSACLVLAGRVL